MTDQPLEDEPTFPCPYCGEANAVVIEAAAGEEQTFTVDCEVCCRPMLIVAHLDEDGVAEIQAERELN